METMKIKSVIRQSELLITAFYLQVLHVLISIFFDIMEPASLTNTLHSPMLRYSLHLKQTEAACIRLHTRSLSRLLEIFSGVQTRGFRQH